MSARGICAPAASIELVRAAAALASTARPSAPPIMKAVLTTPEARPESAGSTSLNYSGATGLNFSHPALIERKAGG